MIDVSLALNAVAAALVVISITFEIPRELRQGVASTLLTKSLGRTQYLAGKLIGIASIFFHSSFHPYYLMSLTLKKRLVSISAKIANAIPHSVTSPT